MLQASVSGYGSIVNASTLEHVIQFRTVTLQDDTLASTYTVMFRARQAHSSKYGIQKLSQSHRVLPII